jgi:arsenical pump membrane protein
VTELAAEAGVFTVLAQQTARWGRGRAWVLWLLVVVVAALSTIFLSLDTTAVLLTPVVIVMARHAGLNPLPFALTTVWMANAGSLLLPVSNLTNLLAMPHLDLTFGGFALVMAPVLAVVLVVEYVALRLLFRRDLAAPPGPAHAEEAPPLPRTPLVVVLLMLVGFGAGSPLGVDPFWVSGAAAVVLVVWARRRGLLTAPDAVRAAHPAFALFVLCLGVVVAALATGFLGEWVGDLLPGGTDFASLLLIAVIATVLANLLTNLSATLLMLPLLAPLGDTAVLAALLGLNIGSGLSYTGSLANLLWRRGMARLGHPPPMREFHRVSLLVTPISLVAAVAALSLVT